MTHFGKRSLRFKFVGVLALKDAEDQRQGKANAHGNIKKLSARVLKKHDRRKVYFHKFGIVSHIFFLHTPRCRLQKSTVVDIVTVLK